VVYGEVNKTPAIPREEPVAIPGPAGMLEARWAAPEDLVPTCCAVICHPHPLYGGTMDNKVVTTLVRTAAALGAATVRFNFRGVGASEGRHDEGHGETGDVLAVIDWSAGRWPGATLWLCGFSFGAYVALAAASRRTVERLVTVAPPLRRMDVESLVLPRCPWLIVQGSADELVDSVEVQSWAHSLSPPPGVAVLSGASHFFHGRLAELGAAVASFLR